MMRVFFKPEWLQAILLGVGTVFAAMTQASALNGFHRGAR